MVGYSQHRRTSSTTSEGALAPAPLSEVSEPTHGNAAAIEQMGLVTPSDGRSPFDLGLDLAEEAGGLTPSAAGDLFGFEDQESPDAGGAVPDHLVAWVDQVLPVGLGVTVSADFAFAIGLGASVGGGITVVNQGKGWLEVEQVAKGGVGGELGLGAKVPGTGATLEGEAGLECSITRTYKVPWTRLADPATLAALATTAVLGAEGSLVEAVLEATFGGDHDLAPFLMSEEVHGGVSGSVGAEGEVLGEALGVELAAGTGLASKVEYDELADEEGQRTGKIWLGGNAEALLQVTLDLSKTLGFDAEPMLPKIAGASGLVIPFEVNGGEWSFSMPYWEVTASAELGPVGASATVSMGPGHTGVGVEVEVDPGSVIWQKALNTVGAALEVASAGSLELTTDSTMKAGLSTKLDQAALPSSPLLPQDVLRYLVTGELPEALAEARGLLDQALANAELSLEVDLTIAALHAQGEAKAGTGTLEKIEGEGELGLVYQRDDLAPEMSAPPTLDDLVALLRGGAPTTTWPKEQP
jgi:hypothetical protein